MGRIFQPATWDGGAPMVEYRLVDASATFKAGALVVTDTDGEIIECGADPALILGVALAPAASAAGYNMANNADIVASNWRENKVPVAIAKDSTVFSGRGSSAPTLTHIGEQYGVVSSSGEWIIDLTETTAKRVTIVGIDTSNAVFFFRFMPATTEQG